MRPRILVSAFEPFGEHAVNASAEAARTIAGRGVAGADVEAICLPVVRGDAVRRLLEAVEGGRYDAVVMLGIAGKRGEITPERIAINVDDYRIPDNSGNSPVDEAVVEGGPAGYFSTLPIRAIVEALEAASIPSKISNTAGTYICNHVAYALAHHLASAEDPPIAGFVHIPQMAEADGWEPSLPLETLVDAVAIVVEVVARAAARV
jgi:pyroglutamyl-peptidase